MTIEIRELRIVAQVHDERRAALAWRPRAPDESRLIEQIARRVLELLREREREQG